MELPASVNYYIFTLHILWDFAIIVVFWNLAIKGFCNNRKNTLMSKLPLEYNLAYFLTTDRESCSLFGHIL